MFILVDCPFFLTEPDEDLSAEGGSKAAKLKRLCRNRLPKAKAEQWLPRIQD